MGHIIKDQPEESPTAKESTLVNGSTLAKDINTDAFGSPSKLSKPIENESDFIRIRVQNLLKYVHISTEMLDHEEKDISTGFFHNIEKGTELIDTLHKIFKHEDDWDGYGTPKISEQLKQICFEILEIICKSRFDLPYVFPVAGGGMQFEWKRGNKDLELEFNENKISALRTEKIKEKQYRYIEDENIELDQIQEIYLWLKNI